jgi:hypothetical protein
MAFNNLKKQIKLTTFDAVRRDEEDYFEAVFFKQDMAKVSARLSEGLGETVYPGSKPLEKKIESLISEHGGIQKGQSLYLKEFDGFIMLAMFWPWQDGEHITLKLFKRPVPAGWR